MDSYVINKYSNTLIAESNSWVYGHSPHNSSNFSAMFEDVHNKMLGEKYLSTKKPPSKQPKNQLVDQLIWRFPDLILLDSSCSNLLELDSSLKLMVYLCLILNNNICEVLCDFEVIVAQLYRTFATPWTVANQIPLSMGCPRQEYWSGLPSPSAGDSLTQGLNLSLLHFRQILSCLSHQGSLCEYICVCVHMCVQLYICIYTYIYTISYNYI